MDPYDYSAEEKRHLSKTAEAVDGEIRLGKFKHHPWGVPLIVELHLRLMGQVRPGGAGRLRSKTWGEDRLVFGPNRSTHRNEVASALRTLFERAQRLRAEVGEQFDFGRAIELAVWLHAELIRIHPFFDGNGRTSRFMLNLALESMGIGCVAVEVVKKEYNHALNAYFASTPPTGAPFGHPALAPLVALVIECYGWQAPT